ncbi:MAG: hypothetical protein AMXMBFR12_03690 [Candidatus Babeliales bacterium]
MQKQLFGAFFCLFWIISAFGVCQRPDRKHENKDIARCPYLQENIYKAFAEKPMLYGELEKYKKCFFCECPISEHNTEVKKETRKPLRKKQKRVIDNSLTHG